MKSQSSEARITASVSSSRRRSRRPTRRRDTTGGVLKTLRQKVRAIRKEWNRKQTTRAGAITVAVGGTLLGLFVHRAFLLLPVGVAAVALRRPVQRWAPRVLMLGRILLRLQALRRRVRGAMRAAIA